MSEQQLPSIPASLHERLAEIASEEERSLASVVESVIATGLAFYQPMFTPRRDLSRFTSEARAALDLAHEEAIAFNHREIGTEHLLLGLLHVNEGPAAHLLLRLGLDLEQCREYVALRIGRGIGPVPHQLRYLPRARKAIGFAIKRADDADSTTVDTLHLLLGVADVGLGVGARILDHFDILSRSPL